MTSATKGGGVSAIADFFGLRRDGILQCPLWPPQENPSCLALKIQHFYVLGRNRAIPKGAGSKKSDSEQSCKNKRNPPYHPRILDNPIELQEYHYNTNNQTFLNTTIVGSPG